MFIVSCSTAHHKSSKKQNNRVIADKKQTKLQPKDEFEFEHLAIDDHPDKVTDKIAPSYKISDEHWAILQQAKEFKLLALATRKTEGETFYKFTILKTVHIAGDIKEQLLAALKKGFAGSNSPVKCFIPHHGIDAQLDDKFVRLLICFSCTQLYLYDHSGQKIWIAINRSPLQVFEKLLGLDRFSKRK